MPRKVRIVTSSFATLENTTPPFNIHPPRPEDNVALAENILITAAQYQPDVVVLPEAFKLAGISLEKSRELAEPIPGPTFNLLANWARKLNTYIVAGMMVLEGSRIFNRGIVIDRTGKLVGYYDKHYPVEEEITHGVTPGTNTPIFDLDFGRIGVSVCFDINWPEIWQEFSNQKIDLAFWISAYEGGFPLQSYAWQFKYPIVSSVWPYHARVFDIDGRIIHSTSRWSRILFCEVNLDRGLFHTDLQMEKISGIQKKYGDLVDIKTYTEEHLFVLENNISGKSVEDIAAEFDLIPYDDYISRCTSFRNFTLKNSENN